jgi:WD40 repeat protein/serine/threonine protein kinase
MSALPSFDEDLVRRLPLPLAQLYRRAHNAKTPLERHLTAFYLWEAALKLLAATAVAEYAQRGSPDPSLTERLQRLARPSLGHWWEFVRLLVPSLADGGDRGFVWVRELVMGRRRDDLPRCAGLDAALRRELQGRPGARATVRLTELFDCLVTFRNKVLAHAAPGQLGDDVNERMARALLAGSVELLGRLDVLAGRRLLYVGEVRQVGGAWLAQRYELHGEGPCRLPALELPWQDAARLPQGERVYLLAPRDGAGGEEDDHLRRLHPLLLYDTETNEALFLNARRGRRRTEYLCYTSGRTAERPDLGREQCELLARVLGMEVAPGRADEWAARSQADEPPVEPAPTVRRLLGDFELLSELGRGGMGVVYRAWQPSLGRQVALKCLFQTGDAKAEARFRREIRALGKVEHPHLVKVFTSGSDGEQWFYAMELVEGTTLAAVCDKLTARSSAAALDADTWQAMLDTACVEARRAEKPLSDIPASRGLTPPERSPGPDARASPGRTAGRSYIRQVVALVRQVAQAAHALHEAGVIHRDIKPGNIMVTGDGGRACLMDLGLAQLADDVEGRLTRTRQFVGTLRYASPEQVLAVGRLDRRTDVYSLGATLYELLTLRPLYGATELTPTPELMQRIQRQEPDPPRRHDPGLPRDLEAVVLKCLEKDPARRYGTALELAEDLHHFQGGQPVGARPVGRVERLGRWCRRNPLVAGLLGVIAASLLAGSAVSTYFAVQASARAEAEGRARGAADQRARQLEWHDYRHRVSLALREWQTGDVARAEQLLDGCAPEFLAWEWHYCKRLCHLELAVLGGLNGPVAGVTYSPDGNQILASDGAGHARLWDARTGQILWDAAGPPAVGNYFRVPNVAFSPDGKRVAIACWDGAVRLRDAVTGGEVGTLRGHAGRAVTVAYSPDGKWLAAFLQEAPDSWIGGGEIVVWEAASGKPVQTIPQPNYAVFGLAFSPDGRRLAGADHFEGVKVWDTSTGKGVLTLRGPKERLWCVAWSPDGTGIVSGGQDATLKLWDAQTGRELRTFRGHAGSVRQVVFSPDGKRIASASEDTTVKVWDATTGEELLTLRGHRLPVYGVAFRPDGRQLASVGWSSVRLWDATAAHDILTLAPDDPAWSVAFGPDGRRLAWGDGSKLFLSDPATGRLLRRLDVPNLCLAFGPDGKQLAAGGGYTKGSESQVGLWDAETGRQVRALGRHEAPVNAVAFSPDGRLVASASTDGVSKLWEADTGRQRFVFPRPPNRTEADRVDRLAFSPDSRWLAAPGPEHRVQVWDVATGDEGLTLRGHTLDVYAVAFSPDGRRLASASEDMTVRLWDTATGRELLALKGHTASVVSVAFSPDGRRIVTGSNDRTLKLWDTATGDEVLTLRGHKAGVQWLAFSPDGRRIATASQDATVKVWDGTPVGP